VSTARGDDPPAVASHGVDAAVVVRLIIALVVDRGRRLRWDDHPRYA